MQNKLQFGKHWKCHTHSVRNVGNDDLNFYCYSSYGTNHGCTNFVKGKMCKTHCSFEKFEITVNGIYTVCAMSEMMI